MNFSVLYQTYHAMREPSYCLKVGGETLENSEDAQLKRLECELTCTRQAGSLYLEAVLDPEEKSGSAWLKALQPGAACTLSLGYGDSRKEVFRGFLYDILWGDPLLGSAMSLEAVFLDVRGRLMLTSCADAGPKRSLFQMVRNILDQPFCQQMAPKKTVNAPPKDWDVPSLRPGASDYSMVCAAADFLCYEFYACADELYFGKPRTKSSPAVTFDGPNGLMEFSRRRTLAGQCAAVSVSGTDDKGERIVSRQPRKADKGFGTQKMSAVLTGDFHQPEAYVRTMAQALYLSKARMEQRQRQAGSVTGRSVGLPELRPGRFLTVSNLNKPSNGTYYVHTVRHILDETGFETWFEAED